MPSLRRLSCMAKSTAEIVYEQAVRAVEQQAQQLDELRTRAAVALAASGIITGFLGRAAVERGLGPFGWLAILAFVVSALACLWVMMPLWDAWAFAIDAKKLSPYFLNKQEPEEPDALFEYLATKIQDDVESNTRQLAPLYKWFACACIALAVQVVLWLLALGLD